ncbi:MFS transporter [Streptomyces sp. NPDC055607]
MRSDYRRFWWAEVGSTFGTACTLTVMSAIAVDQLRASAVEVGLLAAAAYAPALLLGPWTGRFADRTRRPRRQLIRGDLLAFVLLTATCAAALSGRLSIPWLLLLELALGTVALVVETIYFIHLQSIVAPEDLTGARARLQAGEHGATIAGGGLAGLALSVLGGAAVFAVDALTYLASAFLLSRLRAPDEALPEPPEEEESGVRAARQVFGRGGPLFATLCLLLLQSLTQGVGAALLTLFLLRDAGLPVAVLGLTLAFSGLAGVLASWAAVRVKPGRGLRTLLLCALVHVAGSVLVACAAGPVPLALGTAVVGLMTVKAAGAIGNVALSDVITTCAPAHLLGRTVAFLRTSSTACQIVGALIGGAVAAAGGARAALAGAALLPLLAVPLLLKGPYRDARPRRAAAHRTRRNTE